MAKGILELRKGWNWWIKLDSGAKFRWMLVAIAGLLIAGILLNRASLVILRASDYTTDLSLWLLSNAALELAGVLTLPTLAYGLWRWRRLGRWKLAVIALGLIVLAELTIGVLVLLFILSPGPMRF